MARNLPWLSLFQWEVLPSTKIFAFQSTKSWHRTRSQFPMHRSFAGIILVLITFGAASLAQALTFPASGPTVSGTNARLRYGLAAAPEDAPLAVKRAIWAANQLSSKPYRYGGGHRSFIDNGYDCSGTVSYILGGAGLIAAPLNSSDLCSFGQRGRGRWITIYTRKGHAFAVIAGLRLDTTPWDNSSNRFAPRWQTTSRAPAGFEARHPIGL